ncbi:LuxR C-terminal-related transcriptional regulator [Streptomyces sp. NPDC046727]|uniref:helix-turn-helix transcriptional regulator n=1 Tax=Streptomyces sp. NPDC046727 TaxID=3155373 RepID=UPI0033F97564
MSDVLYLINSRNFSELEAGSLTELDEARIDFIRGRSRPALRSIDEMLPGLDPSTRAYRDAVAFRLLVLAMMGQGDDSLPAEAGRVHSGGSEALDIMSLCLRGNECWRAGDLIQGLWLNQSAYEKARGVAPIWRFYAGFLFAKRLIDIHIPYQADRVIRDTRELVESAGLFAFLPMPVALESLRHWQEGHLDRAERCARLTLRLGRQYTSAFGSKIALSVLAMVHLGRGDWTKAGKCLEAFRAGSELYGMPDSVARAAFGEVALVLVREGPRAAAERIRERWTLLGTGSGYAVEDPARPAWLVAVARQAGDAELAERSLREVERLVENNRGVAPLETAAAHARAVMAGDRPKLTTVLPFAHPATRARSLASALTRREHEIARLVVQGMTNQQIALRLGLSPNTVSFHLRNVFRKFSVSTRARLSSIMAQEERGRAGGTGADGW